MARRYLFGPVNSNFADQFLHPQRQSGECLAFDIQPGADLTIGITDSWDSVLSKLPASWKPEFVVLYLPYRQIPACLWSAPIPIVGLAGDWNLLWHWYRHCLPACDIVLSDTAGVETMRRQGMDHCRVANLYGCEKAYFDSPVAAATRDLDVVFVGNFHPAVQQERLPWIGRLVKLGDPWRVVLASQIHGKDYRSLLARARIVFNRSIRGECNMRAFEATASGALLFQEKGNHEIDAYFQEDREYIAYDSENLEPLLEYYLKNEEKRQSIADAGYRRARHFTFDQLWQKIVDQLASESKLIPRMTRQPFTANAPSALLQRMWQLSHLPRQADPTLTVDLQQALVEHPRSSAALQNALAVARFHTGQAKSGEDRTAIACGLRQALLDDPSHVVAALNLTEILAESGQKRQAVEQARHALALLTRPGPISPQTLDAANLRTGFSFFRVLWERAAWTNAGCPEMEEQAKRRLLRWRTHTLLASLTGELTHYYEAVAACPDIPASQTALGMALVRGNCAVEALPYVAQAVATNPFDLGAADALYHTLEKVREWPQQHRLAKTYSLLHQAAPTVIPSRPWFAPLATNPTSSAPADIGPIVWEGGFQALHSLALVNRHLCQRLIERGYLLSLQPGTESIASSPSLPLPPALAEAFGRHFEQPIAVHIRHQWPPNWRPPAEGRWIIMQPWEFGSVPSRWIPRLKNDVDDLWVPSSFVRSCFISNGAPPDRVHVVPNGVDVEHLQRQHPPFRLRTRKRFKFLFVGGTIHRKGIDILLRVYAETFSVADDVCLVIKDMGSSTFYQGQTAHQQIAACQNGNGPEIEYVTDNLSADDLASLYHSCDCLVHPYRGEGFGLPIAEAMACGLPVIVTGYGAALDFCDETRAFLLPATLTHFSTNRIDQFETVDRPWLAEPDPAMLRFFMRFVIEHPNEAGAKGHAAAAFIREHFSWESAVNVIAGRLAKLASNPPHRLQSKMTTLTAENTKGATRHRVSLCMIVRNEQQHLEACLKSVADLVDEMIVVDTGSTDNTKDIAARCGAKVFDFQWTESFAAARNESIKHATGDWILWLDADERLDDVNRGRVRNLLSNLKDENVAYVMRQFSRLQAVAPAAVQVGQVRLFRNRPDIRWQYRVHEQILLAVRNAGGLPCLTDIVIDHAGYSDPPVQGSKVDRNRRLLELELKEHPDDAFVLYNLGAVRLTQERCMEALELFQRSLNQSQPDNALVRKLYALMTRAHHKLGCKDEAMTACSNGLSNFPDDGELLFWQAILLHEQKDLSGAAASLESLLRARPTQNFTSIDAGLYTYRARHFLAEICLELNRPKDAENHWLVALEQCPTFTPARIELAKLFARTLRWQEFAAAVKPLEQDATIPLELLVIRGKFHLDHKRFEAAKEDFSRAIAKSPGAIQPRVLLSHALLQEGVDWVAAERALLDVLALDPENREAKSNLQTLRRQQGDQSNGIRDLPLAVASSVKVSLCMIVRDEEKHLPACLQSIARLVTEIIIVDTGSSDRTKEIAMEHGAKVFDAPWEDHFAKARNESLRHASGQWIFWLDADDRLDRENQTKLQALFANLKDEMAGYVMKCLCLPDSQGVETVVDHLRLFRNHPDARWTFRVHEQILPALRKLSTEVRWSDVVIHHCGYQDTAVRQRKLQRDLRLLHIEQNEQPDHPFTLFNLGSVYQELGRLTEALSMFERSLAFSAPHDSIVRKLYALITQCHRGLGQKDESLASCRDGLRLFPEDIELLFQEAVTLRELGDIGGAIRSWKLCLKSPPAPHFSSINTGLRGHITNHNLAVAYRELGRSDAAESYWKASLVDRPYYPPAWRGLADLYLKQSRWSESEQLAQDLSAGPEGELYGTLIQARVYLARKAFFQARQLLEKTVQRWPDIVEVRSLLSHALLQEGKNWSAAEQTLRHILLLDPDHKEAMHNLAILTQQKARA
ncbi:MAG TPA: glycosyltransferase [Gemmataceae bacterium]|nr:glycosyltransferase [Gemmataceae bacterium]